MSPTSISGGVGVHSNVLEALGRLSTSERQAIAISSTVDEDDSLPPNVPTDCHRPLLTLRLLAKEWVRAKAHAKQLDAYIRSKIVPRGLRIKNDPGVPLPSTQFLDAWYAETEEASLELMSLLRQEHELNSGVLGGEIDQLSLALRQRLGSRDQFDAFTGWVVEGAAIVNERLNGIIRSKYERDVEEYNRNRLAATVRPRTAPQSGRFGRGGGVGGWPAGRGGGSGSGRGPVIYCQRTVPRQTTPCRAASSDSSFGSPTASPGGGGGRGALVRFTDSLLYRPEE